MYPLVSTYKVKSCFRRGTTAPFLPRYYHYYIIVYYIVKISLRLHKHEFSLSVLYNLFVWAGNSRWSAEGYFKRVKNETLEVKFIVTEYGPAQLTTVRGRCGVYLRPVLFRLLPCRSQQMKVTVVPTPSKCRRNDLVSLRYRNSCNMYVCITNAKLVTKLCLFNLC